MVEVTRANFNEMMPLVKKAIKDCTFIAIDTEFTGLDLEDTENDKCKLFDTLPERYQKLKMRATKVMPCQIGLSMFTKDPNDNNYSVETYTFYASSIEFLNNHGFDFNKFLSCGISYLKESEVAQFWQEVREETFSLPHIRMMDFETVGDIDMKINKLLESSKKSNNKYAISGTNNFITLPIQNACHVYFQLNEIRRKYPSTWAYTEDDKIVVKVVTPREKKNLAEEALDDQEKLLKDYLGFTRVFKKLKHSYKPIVGHNFLMDLMLFYQHFCDDLPDCYETFKEELNRQFPFVYDTRQIWLNMRTVYKFKNLPKGSSLMGIYNAFESPVDELTTLYQPSIKSSNCDRYLHDKYPHDSGYDSFITGCVFIKISHLLSSKRFEMDAKPFVWHALKDLTGKDPKPIVPGDLYIIPKTNRCLSNAELSQLFDKFGYVEWMLVNHKRAAIVVVSTLASYYEILKAFKKDPYYVVSKYHPVWHSRYIRPAFWGTALASCCLLALCISKFLNH
ncbi:poly(A)-specific ribonuclease PNLDC1 [Trichonephila clavipes]|nr:poly(A)-specific ribonuclease PNLDC1 [Trichonephila clavipes]